MLTLWIASLHWNDDCRRGNEIEVRLLAVSVSCDVVITELCDMSI